MGVRIEQNAGSSWKDRTSYRTNVEPTTANRMLDHFEQMSAMPTLTCKQQLQSLKTFGSTIGCIWEKLFELRFRQTRKLRYKTNRDFSSKLPVNTIKSVFLLDSFYFNNLFNNFCSWIFKNEEIYRHMHNIK